MTFNGTLQLLLYMVALIALTKPLGGYMARVYAGQRLVLDRVLGPLERLIYWLAIPTLALAGSLVRKKLVPARCRRTRRCSWSC